MNPYDGWACPVLSAPPPALGGYGAAASIGKFRDLPIFGEESIQAAMAARAAGNQGKYWQYHQAVFADTPVKGHPKLPKDKLVAYAEQGRRPGHRAVQGGHGQQCDADRCGERCG